MGISPAANRLQDALFPKARQQLLGILYGAPERSYYANELIRLAGTGTGAVQRELQSLLAAGIVTVERRGHQMHYQANANCPIHAELVSIVNKTLGIPEQLRSALAPLASEIRWALLYGSAAKGNLHSASDIDLMLISDSLTLETLYAALADAEAKLGRRINPTLYTTTEFRKRRNNDQAFVNKVLNGARVELIGTEDALA